MRTETDRSGGLHGSAAPVVPQISPTAAHSWTAKQPNKGDVQGDECEEKERKKKTFAGPPGEREIGLLNMRMAVLALHDDSTEGLAAGSNEDEKSQNTRNTIGCTISCSPSISRKECLQVKSKTKKTLEERMRAAEEGADSPAREELEIEGWVWESTLKKIRQGNEWACAMDIPAGQAELEEEDWSLDTPRSDASDSSGETRDSDSDRPTGKEGLETSSSARAQVADEEGSQGDSRIKGMAVFIQSLKHWSPTKSRDRSGHNIRRAGKDSSSKADSGMKDHELAQKWSKPSRSASLKDKTHERNGKTRNPKKAEEKKSSKEKKERTKAKKKWRRFGSAISHRKENQSPTISRTTIVHATDPDGDTGPEQSHGLARVIGQATPGGEVFHSGFGQDEESSSSASTEAASCISDTDPSSSHSDSPEDPSLSEKGSAPGPYLVQLGRIPKDSIL